MFKTVLWGIGEEEALDYMDRLLAVIECQNGRERRKKGSGANHDFLIDQMRKDLQEELCCHRKRRRRRYFLMGVVPVLCLILAILSVCLYLGAAQVTGDSMSPAVKAGDIVLYGKGQKSYERGELVVCDVEGIRLIKRVAAVPGDIIRQDESGTVKITSSRGEWQDGVKVSQQPGETGADSIPSRIFLNQDEYFLLGDNRDLSVDSRDARIGPVNKERIRGKVILVIRPSM